MPALFAVALLGSASLASVVGAEKLAADCTNSRNESCLKSGCCNIPGTKCFQKNKKWAACRETCIPGPHYNEPPYNKDPWSCIELTGGCSGYKQPCGVRKGYKGTPCCQWGCQCNKTSWGAWCVLTNHSGKYTCNKADEKTSGGGHVENFDARRIPGLPVGGSFLPSAASAPFLGLAAFAGLGAVGLAIRSARKRSRPSKPLATEAADEGESVEE